MNFKDISIRSKISILVVAICLATLIVSSLLFFVFDSRQYKKMILEKVTITADVIGGNNTANIIFNNPQEAATVLRTLIADDGINVARIYDNDDNIFAEYIKEPEYAMSNLDFITSNASHKYVKRTLLVKRPIILDNEKIGATFLNYSMEGYYARRISFIHFLLGLFTAALIIVLLLTVKLQRIISTPIINLTNTMRSIEKNLDYITVDDKRKDEIGQLINGFNSMITQIKQQNQDLVLAKNQAENSAKIKDQFLANMSHEIRTPMNGVIGMAKLLENTPLSAEQKCFLDNISISASNLLVIINDILDFSKIEAGKMELEEIEFNLSNIIDTLNVVYTKTTADKRLYFKLNIDDNVPKMLWGDPTRLTQILNNLIGNAVKFTEYGGITLTIKSREMSHNFTHLKFIVSDTGIGIPQEKQDLIFKSFSQASSDTTRKYGGTGLGLTISRQLALMHKDGNLTVSSQIDKGSTFCFDVTYKQSNATPEPIVKTTERPKPIEGKNRVKVLLAEDNEINQLFVKTILKPYFDVYSAENGKIVVDWLRKEDFDIILMDLHMPEMDGYQATSEIRKMDDERINNIPIIALTAAAIKGEREKCIDSGMNDYISKPFNPDELIDKIFSLVTPSENIANKPEESPKSKIKPTEFKYINTKYLDSITDGDENFQHQLVSIFIDQVPELKNNMLEAFESHNYHRLSEVAHKAKSSVAMMGMSQLREHLARLEQSAKEGIEAETYKEKIDLFIVTCEAAIEECKNLL